MDGEDALRYGAALLCHRCGVAVVNRSDPRLKPSFAPETRTNLMTVVATSEGEPALDQPSRSGRGKRPFPLREPFGVASPLGIDCDATFSAASAL